MAEQQAQVASRKVLIPMDESEHSKRAFEFYLENLHRVGDKVYFCHIFHPPSYHFSFKKENEPTVMIDDIKERLEKQLEIINKILTESFESRCTELNIAKETVLRAGNAGSGIVDLVGELDINLVIMGSRGLNALRRTFVGSVSDYVLHHCHVPVTIVPPPHH